MNKNRVELFSDGVFAIVLTLLVLNLKVPSSHGIAAVRDISPALAVHATVFGLVGMMWIGHHGTLARVDRISQQALLFNLLVLFWVTLLPFAAENAADRPSEPLGASMLAFCCSAFMLSFLGMRLSMHSTIDDHAGMQAWRRSRQRIAGSLIIWNLACAVLAWWWIWTGYAGPIATVVVFLVLRSPPEAERDFDQRGSEIGDRVSSGTP